MSVVSLGEKREGEKRRRREGGGEKERGGRRGRERIDSGTLELEVGIGIIHVGIFQLIVIFPPDVKKYQCTTVLLICTCVYRLINVSCRVYKP